MTNSNLFASLNLTPQARLILAHIDKAGSISARDAMADYGITSASLTRRIFEIARAGIQIERERRRHPVTGRHYTRYWTA